MKVVHHSSRFDRDGIKTGTRASMGLGSVVLFTEMDRVARRKQLADTARAHGWSVWRDSTAHVAELVAIWDPEKWEKRATAIRKLSPLTWPHANPVGAAAILLERPNGQRFGITWTHMPSKTTDGCANWRWTDGIKTRVYQDAEPVWARWVSTVLDRKWKPDCWVISADWNHPMECPRARAWHDQTWPTGWRVASGPYLPTHGRATYDWFLLGPGTKGGKATAWPMPDSDHKTVVMNVSRK